MLIALPITVISGNFATIYAEQEIVRMEEHEKQAQAKFKGRHLTKGAQLKTPRDAVSRDKRAVIECSQHDEKEDEEEVVSSAATTVLNRGVLSDDGSHTIVADIPSHAAMVIVHVCMFASYSYTHVSAYVFMFSLSLARASARAYVRNVCICWHAGVCN